MKKYKEIKYFFDKNDKLWKIFLDQKRFFIVALDDSKNCGYRKIVQKNNTENNCKKYIDWIKKS